MNKTEKVARIICKDQGCNPDALEPGDRPRIDGTCPNGDPGHFVWRQFVPLAKKIIKALEA